MFSVFAKLRIKNVNQKLVQLNLHQSQQELGGKKKGVEQVILVSHT